MAIDVKAQLADGEAFYRNGANIDGVSLPIVQATSDITPDVVTNPGYMDLYLAANPSCDGLTLASHATTTSARLATIAPLPACTYNNGPALGVGATLTGDANGALADIDFTTPVAGDRILVRAQASALQNGIYVVTTLGTAGTPFVLTRVPEADEAASYVDGVSCMISSGLTLAGAVAFVSGAITMGTTAIEWQLTRPDDPLGGANLGPARNRRRYFTDFEELETTLTDSSGTVQRIPGTNFSVILDGTATAAAQIVAEAQPGVVDLQTGTDTDGFAGVVGGLVGSTLSASVAMRFGARVKIPTTSDGTQTFICRVGWMATVIATAPTGGAYFEFPGNGGNILAVTRVGGVETATDTGIAQSAFYRSLAIIYDPLALAWRFYTNVSGVFTLVATNTTNVPTGLVLPGAAIDKSAGTTSRSLYVDLITADGRDARTPLALFP